MVTSRTPSRRLNEQRRSITKSLLESSEDETIPTPPKKSQKTSKSSQKSTLTRSKRSEFIKKVERFKLSWLTLPFTQDDVAIKSIAGPPENAPNQECFAVCGGNEVVICMMDGKVLARYVAPDSDDFNTLAWTWIPKECPALNDLVQDQPGKREIGCHVIAVGGKNRRVQLLYLNLEASKFEAYGVFQPHEEDILHLVFSKVSPRILFSSSKDTYVKMYHVMAPDELDGLTFDSWVGTSAISPGCIVQFYGLTKWDEMNYMTLIPSMKFPIKQDSHPYPIEDAMIIARKDGRLETYYLPEILATVVEYCRANPGIKQRKALDGIPCSLTEPDWDEELKDEQDLIQVEWIGKIGRDNVIALHPCRDGRLSFYKTDSLFHVDAECITRVPNPLPQLVDTQLVHRTTFKVLRDGDSPDALLCGDLNGNVWIYPLTPDINPTSHILQHSQSTDEVLFIDVRQDQILVGNSRNQLFCWSL